MKSVSVFCSSSDLLDDSYMLEASVLGRELALANYKVLFGGGGRGLMKVVADEFLKTSAHIQGIMPHFMIKNEWNHPGIEDMLLVETMAQRKQMLIAGADAFIVLPGSIGTLEEVVEVLSAIKLDLVRKPVIFINTNNFFAPLFLFFEKMVEEKFMDDTNLYAVVENASQAVLYLDQQLKPLA